MINKHLNVIPVLLISFSLLLLGVRGTSSSDAVKDARNTAVAGRAYDGDTIAAFVDGRFQKVRLIGIDAPEMDQKPWGRKAQECTEALIKASGFKVSLEYDLERRDKYGRILAYIWAQDGKMINEEMLRKGCAVLFTVPPNVKYAGRLRTAQEKARESKVGVWGENGLNERPYDFRKEHPRR